MKLRRLGIVFGCVMLASCSNAQELWNGTSYGMKLEELRRQQPIVRLARRETKEYRDALDRAQTARDKAYKAYVNIPPAKMPWSVKKRDKAVAEAKAAYDASEQEIQRIVREAEIDRDSYLWPDEGCGYSPFDEDYIAGITVFDQPFTVWYSFSSGHLQQVAMSLNPSKMQRGRAQAFCDDVTQAMYRKYGVPVGTRIDTTHGRGSPGTVVTWESGKVQIQLRTLDLNDYAWIAITYRLAPEAPSL